MIVSEQYPKGLGSTVQEMDLSGAKLVIPKTKFSMVLPEVEASLAEIPGLRSVVLFGVEVRGTAPNRSCSAPVWVKWYGEPLLFGVEITEESLLFGLPGKINLSSLGTR